MYDVFSVLNGHFTCKERAYSGTAGLLRKMPILEKQYEVAPKSLFIAIMQERATPTEKNKVGINEILMCFIIFMK